MNARAKIQSLWILAGLKRRELQDRAQIKKLQEKKLWRILASANELPHYQGMLQKHEINGEACTIEDLRRLPVLTKDTLRQHLSQTIGDQRRKDRLWYLKTTGSSGTPLTIATTERELTITNTLIRYAFLKSGLRHTDTLCSLIVGTEKLKDKTLLQRMGIGRQYTLNLQNEILYNIGLLNKLKPDALYCYPSYLTILAKYAQEKQISLPSVRLIFTNGEMLTPQARHLLQTAFTATVRDTYGSAEFGRLAYECQHNRLHVIPDAAIIEVIIAIETMLIGDCPASI